MALLAYFVLLCVWPLFLWPLARGPRGVRTPLTLAVASGAVALGYELWMQLVWTSRVVGPIRLDIPLLVAGLVAVDGLAGLALWRHGWKRTARVAGATVIAASVAFAAAGIGASFEIRRLDRIREEGNRLLFEAKFRNRLAYERAFGFADESAAARGAVADLPVGHWESDSEPVYRRLVVSPAGRAFLFYRCGSTECAFGPGAQLTLRSEPGGAPHWTATAFGHRIGQRRLSIRMPESDAIRVEIDGRESSFRATPPPLLRIEEGEALAELGVFSSLEPAGSLVRVSQLWLWRDADRPLSEADLYAVMVLEYLVPNRRADFVTPVPLGRGTPTPDGSWRFRWQQAGRAREARVRLEPHEDRVHLELVGEGQHWPPHGLRRGAWIRDEVIERASRESPEAWRHWVDTLLTMHFSSADVPALPGSAVRP